MAHLSSITSHLSKDCGLLCIPRRYIIQRKREPKSKGGLDVGKSSWAVVLSVSTKCRRTNCSRPAVGRDVLKWQTRTVCVNGLVCAFFQDACMLILSNSPSV